MSPFKSSAQRRYLFAKLPEVANVLIDKPADKKKGVKSIIRGTK